MIKRFGWFLVALPLFANAAVIDLTHSVDDNTLGWPTVEPFHFKYSFNGVAPLGFYYSAGQFSTSEHVGTHLDAPYHFNEKGLKTAAIPLDQLVGDAIVVDVVAAADKNPDYLIAIEDFKNWEKQNGKIPENTIILLKTGYGKKWSNRKAYTGTNNTGEKAISELHFPGLDPQAAQWLIKQRKLKAIGIDTLSIDYGQTKMFGSHQALTAAQVPIFENVADLSQLPVKDFEVIALPMKIAQGTGAPLRIIAKVN